MVYVYDTTLRDGAQTPHLNLSLEGKLKITELLHELGIPYIEVGFAGSNQRDELYFQEVMEHRQSGLLPHSKIAAFGMTARTRDVENDPYLRAVAATCADVYTIVGKTDKKQVREVLRLSPLEYLEIIRDSVDFLKSKGREVVFDAEHFFDGYMHDKDYALKALEYAGNADCLVLCDTNGGSWPEEVYETVLAAKQESKNQLGIHCHNDRELAVANSLAAARAGAEQVQGTMNGLGERAGNASLSSLIANLHLMGYHVIPDSKLPSLTRVAREIGRTTGRRVPHNAPYVGSKVFYHTGGMHTDAMIKMPTSYEHTPPESVGNRRRFVMSEQSGKAGVRWWADWFGLSIPDENIPAVMEDVKRLQNFGEAQIYLLLRKAAGDFAEPFKIMDGRVIDRFEEDSDSETTIKVRVDGHECQEVSTGNGPVHAIDLALRKALEKTYPKIEKLELADYDVALPEGERGTEARVDVSITFRHNGEEFESRATDTDIVKASKKALTEAYAYYILRH